MSNVRAPERNSSNHKPEYDPGIQSGIVRRMEAGQEGIQEVGHKEDDGSSHGNVGDSQEMENLSPAGYFDSNWASSILMDASNNEMLYNMEFERNGNGNGNGAAAAAAAAMIPGLGYGEGSGVNVGEMDPNYGNNNGLEGSLAMAGSQDPRYQGALSQHSKMSKQRRPCDRCRKRKTKCVLLSNLKNCTQCEAKRLTCTYVGQAMKRKAGPDPENEGKKMKTTGSAQEVNLNNVGGGISSDANVIVPPDVPIRDVEPVQDYSSINNSLLRKTLSLQFPRSSFYVGPTSYLYDAILLNGMIKGQQQNQVAGHNTTSNVNKIDQINLNSSTSLRKVSDKAHFVLRDDQSPHSYQSMSNDVDAIEKFVAPHGQILIDLYFRIIHPSYPILHKKVFLEKYSRTHREFSAPLLAAVYVLAIQWWDYDPQLNRFPKPNVEYIFRIGLNNYLVEILKRPKLSAVQAGLLLLQCKHMISQNDNPPPPNNSKSSTDLQSFTAIGDTQYSDWVLCSQVIALSEELGLGLNCNDWKLPKWERCLRKRLAWAVFMEDKWLSLKNARPSHINEDNWLVQSLIEEDFPEKHGDGDLKEGSSDINNGKKIFMNLCELTKILAGIMNSFYTIKAMAEVRDIGQILQIAKPLQLKLRNWYHSLPSELQMSSVQPRKLCSNGYLQLAYFATELTLHRRIITALHQHCVNGDPPPQELINVCRTAAKTRCLASIDFIRDLKPEHIHSFWHSSTQSNIALIGTFASLLFVSAGTKEEADFYKDQIFNYRWILKISLKGFDQAGNALYKLDSVLSHVPGLLSESSDLPIVVPNVPSTDYNVNSKKPNREPNYELSSSSQSDLDKVHYGHRELIMKRQSDGPINIKNDELNTRNVENSTGTGIIIAPPRASTNSTPIDDMRESNLFTANVPHLPADKDTLEQQKRALSLKDTEAQ